jgi:transposase
MFCNELTKVPIYYNRYNGSLTDRANLSYALANAKAVGIKRVKLVLDGGFWSEKCIASLRAFCDTFTMGMPAYLKESKKILSVHGGGIEQYANELGRHHVYCVPVRANIHGVPGRVLLYYDAQNHLNQCLELSNHIARLNAELETLKRYPKSKLSRYTPYFVLTKHEGDSGFDFHVDNKKVEKLRKAKGFFLLFSTDMKSSPEAILDYYRAKDADEKLFAQIKVDMDGSRIRTHNEQTTDGKTFVTFIACVIRSYLLNRLSRYLTDNSTSMKKVLSQLSNITVLSSNGEYRLTKALTKVQKDILSLFDSIDDIESSIKQL